jgi:hypothetical protein
MVFLWVMSREPTSPLAGRDVRSLREHKSSNGGEAAQLSDPGKSFEPCCKDMTTAMSVPAGRHFFVENGVLMLTVARAILKDGSEGIIEHPVRFCPFCGKPVQGRAESAGPWGHR